MSEFKLPDVGEGLTEAEIVAWKVKVGDVVAINDIIVEIETAKSLVELPSPFAGTVLDLMVPEGETVPVGTPIISIGDASAAPAEAAPAAPATPAPTQAEMEIDLSNPRASGGGEGESLVGRNKAERGAVRRARRGAPTAGVAAGATAANAQAQGAFAPGPSPVVEGCRRARRARHLGGPGRRSPAGHRAGPGRGDLAVRGTRAGQAAGAQAGQGPRHRPRHGHPVRPERHRHPCRRGGARRRARRRDARYRSGCPGDHRRTTSRPASARPASRSRASAR